MNQLPAAIGKYRIERELGRGASGTVYLAYDGFRDTMVAVKQIHARLLVDPAQAVRYRRMLHNEASMAGRLNHPHIVAVIDVDERSDPPYLVLEYIKGRSLEGFASADSLLPVAEVLDIAFKCCNALEYAQTQGLVHRDIKPANLMLQDDGELKLTDFGTAVSVHTHETQVAGLVGSPAYMSPEQIREDALTYHSDMFSLGVVIYELLTGQKPFQGDTDYATIYRISSEPAPPLRIVRPELPTKLDAVISRALAKKPADRFATWSEFADALMGASSSLPALASQTTEAVRFQLLRGMAFFVNFGDVALWETLRLGKIHALEEGGILMQEGASGGSFYMLLEGRVTVSRNGWALSTLSEGGSIGEMVYLQPEQKVRTATVVAETDIVVLKIQGESLRNASPELQACFDKAFIKILASRLMAANRQLAEWDAN
jgi:serine/threonine protein kinase